MQRKLRVLLTGIAIALGVALMAGTYILTDTINHSFAGIFQTAANGQRRRRHARPRRSDAKARSKTSPITDAMLAQVRATPGVAEAAGGDLHARRRSSTCNRKRLTKGGAPAFVASELPDALRVLQAGRGPLPADAGEVAIDEATAARQLKLGQQMIVAGAAPAKRYTIVGIVKFGGGESFGGAGAAVLIPPEAQRVVGEPGRFDQIDVAAAARRHARRSCATASARCCRAPWTCAPAPSRPAKDTSDLESNLSFLRTFLLVFAYVALVVGAFIIFNTFSITVAQRTREFGLLRTLGASRGQIMRSVVDEGLLLGVVGAVLGLLGGIGLAPALDQLFKAFGADLPDSGTVLETRTIVVSLLVGIVVTVLAGLPPALRATRVPPLAAMREGVEIPPRPLPTRRALIVRFVLGLSSWSALGGW